MTSFLGNSSTPNYIKLLAVLMLFCTYLAALVVATLDYIKGIPAPQVIDTIIGTGLGLAINTLGIHQGAQMNEGSKSNASTPTP